MATGKNKLVRYMRMYVDEFDLSGDSREIGGLQHSFNFIDMTSWEDTMSKWLSDQYRMVGVEGYRALMNDAAGRSWNVLKTSPQDIDVSVYLGGNAPPAVGDMCYLLPATQFGDQTDFGSKVGIIQADFNRRGSLDDVNVQSPWGKVLMPKTALTASTNGTGVDQASGGTSGGFALFHITASDAGTWAFEIEHSTTGAFGGEETTLLSFTLDGSVVGSEYVSVSGTVNRYVRFVATRTSGNVTVLCGFVKN